MEDSMTLLDHITELPMPAKLLRGTPKRQTTITISEAEDDVLGYLATKLPMIFDKKKSEVVRAALMAYVWELESLVDTDWKPVIQQLKDIHKHSNYLQNKQAIAEYLDRKADMYNTLLDFNNFNGALGEYSNYLTEINQLPAWWQEVITGMAVSHPGIQKFINRIDAMGHEAILAFKELND